MKLFRFAKRTVLLAIGLPIAALLLQASVIDFSISDPNQIGAPGSTNLFDGTITNNTGGTLASTDLFFNFADFDFTNVTLTQILGDTSFNIPTGTTSGPVELFSLALASTADVPATYSAQVQLEDFNADLSPVYTASVSTVPEPRFLPFALLAALLLFFSAFRKRMKLVLPIVAIALVVERPSAAQVSGVQLGTGKPGLAEIGTTLMIALPITNNGTVDATNVKVTSATLRSATLESPSFPVTLGTIDAGESAIFQADFNASLLAANTSYLLTVNGTYMVGAATAGFSINRFIVRPSASPGSGTVNLTSVIPQTVTGGGFPSQPVDFPDDANSSAPPIPTGPFSAVTPSGGTSLGGGNFFNSTFEKPETRNLKMEPRATVGFNRDMPLGLTSGGTSGTASQTAEPSGGASADGFVFVSANWTVAYSTNFGASFNPQLDPTTVFPKDAVGFCCDQIVQYVPGIDRVIWLLQGNGYRLASASPAQIASSNGKAWTYWNLTPSVFGPTGSGFDYPDMSVGNNDLYISWDTGCSPNCNGGRQIARISLKEIEAGGTINIGYTTPGDSSVAWGSHLTQDTGNTIYWAGNNGNSTLRVFSWAEDSNTYFWRDIGIGSWANNTPLVSQTPSPDSQNWVDFLFDPTSENPGGGFPLFGVLGSTRSGNQLWFAWSAGTDNNFPNPHIEMVTLDLNNNYNLIQQVQIWSRGATYAYPALATNACTGEIGLSLETGGNGNYENHAVGFWGDFVVYTTTDSNAGGSRFGDYVSIRQNVNPNLHGAYFDAFGYGLNTSINGGITTDVRYVVFGRPGACVIN